MTDDELKALVARVFGGPSGYRSFNPEEALKVHPHLMKDLEGIARAVPKLLGRIAELETTVKIQSIELDAWAFQRNRPTAPE